MIQTSERRACNQVDSGYDRRQTANRQRSTTEKTGQGIGMKFTALFIASAMMFMVIEGCDRYAGGPDTYSQKIDRALEKSNMRWSKSATG